MRGSWRPIRTANYWPPLLWPSAFLSHSPELLNRRPGGPALCWVLAFSTTSFLQTLLVSKLPDFLSSLSYIIVQRPLLWNGMFWSSSSGNNCHAVHRSPSSGASVCDCTVGFQPCPILSAKLTHANGICTSPVFGMACLARSEVNIQQKEIVLPKTGLSILKLVTCP